jgi:hypothetical protein
MVEEYMIWIKIETSGDLYVGTTVRSKTRIDCDNGRPLLT